MGLRMRTSLLFDKQVKMFDGFHRFVDGQVLEHYDVIKHAWKVGVYKIFVQRLGKVVDCPQHEVAHF